MSSCDSPHSNGYTIDSRARAHLPPVGLYNPYLAHARPNVIPELYDIPLGMVNRVAYTVRQPSVTVVPSPSNIKLSS